MLYKGISVSRSQGIEYGCGTNHWVWQVQGGEYERDEERGRFSFHTEYLPQTSQLP
jgi:hypothetical protein